MGAGAAIVALAAAVLVAVRLLEREQQPHEEDAIGRLLSLGAWVSIVLLFLMVISVCSGILIAPLAVVCVFLVLWRLHRANQYELVVSLAVSAERSIPLIPAVEALAVERWGLARRRTEKLAGLLRAGWTLPDALAQVPGLVPRRVLVLVRMGYASDLLAASLREALAERETFSGLKMQAAARLAYLGACLLYATVLISFTMVKIVPSFYKIFQDFGMELPWLTRAVIGVSADCGFFLLLGFLLAGMLAVLLLVLWRLDAVPFRLPLLGCGVWRLHAATVLEALALWVRNARPLPEAIALLARWYPRWPVRRQLEGVLADLNAGGDWGASLLRHELIGRADLAVLHAAQKAGNLSWAFGELADGRRRRLAFRLQTLLQCLFPFVILVYGLAVMVFVVAFFIPLVRLISSLV
jgi:type II secretory pathway component PulF